jgi:transposase-like protein
MIQPELSLLEFNKRFGNERACQNALEKMRWPEGFKCPKCQHIKATRIKTRRLLQCCKCHFQVSLTSGTIFHKTRTPLQKWFWAIYLASQDKGGVSAMRLSKQLELGYKTAWAMLHKIRKAMAQRDNGYTLSGFIELDDAFFGGAAKGRRGRGAANKTPVLVMVESKGEHAGFIAMQITESMERPQVETLVKKHIAPAQRIRTDGYKSYTGLAGMGHRHDGSPVPPDKASEDLPWVHTAISNAKRFLLGTYHGVSHKHLQRYLDEFCYRFNRRTWEKQITLRLLTACIFANPITYAELKA